MGIVRGRVVLSPVDPALSGTRFLIVEVVTPERLAGLAVHADGETSAVRGAGLQPGAVAGAGARPRTLIVADRLDPAPGQVIGFVEGREAANPYGPRGAPVDATCSLIVDRVDYRRVEAESG
jgi:microcompartment protein CcmK/EutM